MISYGEKREAQDLGKAFSVADQKELASLHFHCITWSSIALQDFNFILSTETQYMFTYQAPTYIYF